LCSEIVNLRYLGYLTDVTPKHPAQLYETICYVFVFAILMFLYWKTQARNKAGYLFGLFLFLLWSIRFVVEFVKESQGGYEQYPILIRIIGSMVEYYFYLNWILLCMENERSKRSIIQKIG
jgi:prolipoprotein diacylglyceryltransferase